MKKKKIRITKNTIEILKIIYGFRYTPFKILMELDEVKRMYSFRQSLHYAVLQLERRGLIRSIFYGNNDKVVFLTALGAKILSEALNEKIFSPNQRAGVKYFTLQHTVENSKILGKIFSNFPVKKWYGDQQLFFEYSFLSVKNSKKVQRKLKPDGYFVIETEKGDKAFFLEYDTGTMGVFDLIPKFQRYFEFYSYGSWRERFETFPSLLFITDRKEAELNAMIQPVQEEVNKFIMQRDLFLKSKNIIYKGIGNADNIRSMNSQSIRDFINLNFIFTFTYKPWIEELKKYL